jgi:hypothetical protein
MWAQLLPLRSVDADGTVETVGTVGTVGNVGTAGTVDSVGMLGLSAVLLEWYRTT